MRCIIFCVLAVSILSTGRGSVFTDKLIVLNTFSNPSVKPIITALDLGWLEVRDTGTIKGSGLYVTNPVQKGQFIGEYKGETLSYKQYKSKYPTGNSQYVFLLSNNEQRRNRKYIDANNIHTSNLIRYTNHCHISPNTEAVTISIPLKQDIKSSTSACTKSLSCIYLQAIRDINIDEELLFDYGPLYTISWNNPSNRL
eukprot:gene11600-24285_t